MAEKRRFRVYLAGPITDCNVEQREAWRKEVKGKYGDKLDFLDPAENLMNGSFAASEFIKTDVEAIENADGLLVNMWKESIGSAIGIVHAHLKGKPVVVANPNHLENKMLEFYTDIMTETPLKAANALLDLLRAEKDWSVIKSGAKQDEQFNRSKLTDALREACRNAGCDDVVLPRLVLPRVIDNLKKTDRKIKRRLPTGTIDEEVKEVLVDLADEIPQAGKVAEAWRNNRLKKRETMPQFPAAATRKDNTRIAINISNPKSHATLWGKSVKKLDDVKSAEARKIFSEIGSVAGVTKIVIGPFVRGESRSRCSALVQESKTPFVIEGKIFDSSDKGTLQMFQVRIQMDAEKSKILREIESRLKGGNYWAG